MEIEIKNGGASPALQFNRGQDARDTMRRGQPLETRDVPDARDTK